MIGKKEDDFVEEDDMIMSCGHKGVFWSSGWKRCMKCAEQENLGE